MNNAIANGIQLLLVFGGIPAILMIAWGIMKFLSK